MGNIILPRKDSVARYFFDTEFIENGVTIDLISIGIVTEDSESYYAVSTEADLTQASPWVRDHVLPSLPLYGTPHWKTRGTIRDEITGFVSETCKERPVEFWAYYADYDWVALCQLFGTMMELPSGYPAFPKYCMDLKQLSELIGGPRHPKDPAGEHNALVDAEWNLELFRFLRDEAEREEAR